MRNLIQHGLWFSALVAIIAVWQLDRMALLQRAALANQSQVKLTAAAQRLRSQLDEYDNKELLIRRFMLANLKPKP